MEIMKKKISYAVSPALDDYLLKYGRRVESVPEIYRDLSRFSGTAPYESPAGTETLWHSVMYPPGEMAELRPKRIDFGEFGNSRPFRIRIINRYNDNFDHYYVKSADASRIYGLELEHILSPTRINYLVNGDTLIEEHIAGLPGDVFLRDWLHRDELNEVRVAKEFVKSTTWWISPRILRKCNIASGRLILTSSPTRARKKYTWRSTSATTSRWSR